MKEPDKSIFKESQKRYRFIFADPPREVVFEGLKSDSAKERIDAAPVYREMKSKIGVLIERIALSITVNNIVHIPFRDWFHSIREYDFKESIDYYIIVPTMSLVRWNINELEKLRDKNKNIKFVLLVLDSLHAESWHLQFVREKIFSDIWEVVVTYDQNDAKEYGFAWLGYTYYPYVESIPKSDVYSDALYIGFNKGKRNHLIASIYTKLVCSDVNCFFRIIKNGKEEQTLAPGLSLSSRRYKYCEIAAMANNTNCIIEVLMDGQKTQSYRYFEAITYNKKLLTNNPNVSSLPYYDDRYMKYFSSVEDVDPQWVKKKEKIDYGYQGEFSQIHLLDYLEGLLELDPANRAVRNN